MTMRLRGEGGTHGKSWAQLLLVYVLVGQVNLSSSLSRGAAR
jgi:hypothetical protein